MLGPAEARTDTTHAARLARSRIGPAAAAPRPPPTSSRPKVIASVSFTSRIGSSDAGKPTVAYPAPALIAAEAAMTGAPVSPRDPPTINTSPELNLVDSEPRRGGPIEDLGADHPRDRYRRRIVGIPIGATTQPTGPPLPRRDVLADLPRMEGDGEVGIDGDAGDLAGRGVDAGGDVAGGRPTPPTR